MKFEILFTKEKNELFYVAVREDNRFGKLAVLNTKTKEFAIKDVKSNGSMAFGRAIKGFNKEINKWERLQATTIFKNKDQAETLKEFLQVIFYEHLTSKLVQKEVPEPNYPMVFGWRSDFEEVPENKLIVIAIEDTISGGYMYFTGRKVGDKLRHTMAGPDDEPAQYESELKVNIFNMPKMYWMEIHDV